MVKLMGVVTPHDIATAIRSNCDRYDAHQIDRETWSVTQHQLWALAAKKCCAASVMRAVCPSLSQAKAVR